jgi:hypothetical protein
MRCIAAVTRRSKETIGLERQIEVAACAGEIGASWRAASWRSGVGPPGAPSPMQGDERAAFSMLNGPIGVER